MELTGIARAGATMNEELTPGNVRSNDGLGAWLPIEAAPASGLVQLAVQDAAGERRTFAAEASHEGGVCIWMITVGWSGWVRLHPAWTPIAWQRLSQAPNARLSGAGTASA
jgi:hypothetical protein